MKRILSFLCVGLFVCAFGTACSTADESVILSSTERTAAVESSGTVVSVAQAADVAQAFSLGNGGEDLATRGAAALKTPSSVAMVKGYAGEPAMHVLNYPGGGFAIVSATRDYYPVLAYSDEGSFELRDDMGPVEVWLDETREAIRIAPTLDAEAKASIRAQWNELEPATAVAYSASKTRAGAYDPQMVTAMGLRMIALKQQYESAGWADYYSLEDVEGYLPAGTWEYLCEEAERRGSPPEYTIVALNIQYITNQVGPLLTTTWNQEYPYNYDCLLQAVGCVPVAIAQIMKFHGKPTSYAWSSMQDVQYSYLSTALTRFLKEVGNRAGITYTGPGGDSGATIQQAKSAFESYNYTTTLSNNDALTVRNWLFSEEKPVYMRGGSQNSAYGHAWVCDGVTTTELRTMYFMEYADTWNHTYYGSDWAPSHPGYGLIEFPSLHFYMNWGWGGAHNGWFLGSNINNPNGNYNVGRQNIYAKPR